MNPDRAENFFSVHTQGRTIDFEVDNPWLVLLVVRALRLFLGAHYDTLPAPTFFSHLCLRPAGAERHDSPKQALVWTGDEKMPGDRAPGSTPTEHTSGDSASDDSRDTGPSGHLSSASRARTPWDEDTAEGVTTQEPIAGDNGDAGGADPTKDEEIEAAVIIDPVVPPTPPSGQALEAAAAAEVASVEEGVFDSDAGSTVKEERATDEAARPNLDDIFGEEADGSPGGVMALFSSASRRSADEASFNGGDTIPSNRWNEPPTASQLLATRGMTKRLNMSKKMSAANAREGPLKGKRFELMALPMEQSGRDRGNSESTADSTPSECSNVFFPSLPFVVVVVAAKPKNYLKWWHQSRLFFFASRPCSCKHCNVTNLLHKVTHNWRSLCLFSAVLPFSHNSIGCWSVRFSSQSALKACQSQSALATTCPRSNSKPGTPRQGRRTPCGLLLSRILTISFR